VGVVWKCFACFGALRTDIRARFANDFGIRTAARDDLGRCRAHIGTILTRHQCLDVLGFAGVNLMSTVRRARVAHALTIGTCLRARLHFRARNRALVSSVVGGMNLAHRRDGPERRARYGKLSATEHG
jgi:hypothetical protein